MRRLLRAWRRPRPVRACPPPPPSGPRPPLSVVTIVLDRRDGFRRVHDCLRRQTFRDFEWIVQDGGSTDGTLDEIRTAVDPTPRFTSEPDAGLYDALDRAIARTRGRWIQLLHSDDWFPDDYLERAMGVAEASDADFVHGDNRLHLERGEVMMLRGCEDWARWPPGRFLPIRHTTVLARRSLYERVGLFRTDLEILSDLDWLWRAHRSGARGVYDPTLVADMGAGGISTRRMRLARWEAAALTARLPGVARLVPLALLAMSIPGVPTARRLLRR